MKKTILGLIPFLVIGLGVSSCNNSGDGNSKFMVSFDSKGGSYVTSKIVQGGQKVEQPGDPTRNFYTFKGWYLDNEIYNFDSPVISNITLDAKWEENLGEGEVFFNFQSDYCYLNTDEKVFQKGIEQTFIIKLNNQYKDCYDLPNDVEVLIGSSVGKKGEDYNYYINGDEGVLIITLKENTALNVRYSDSDNIYRVLKDDYDKAINMTDIPYMQREYQYLLYTPNAVSIIDKIDYISPTVNYSYSGTLDGVGYGGNNVRYTETYYSIEDNKYYFYRKNDSDIWEKSECPSSEYLHSQDLSPKYLLDSEDVTYENVKDHFDKTLNAYMFTINVTSGQTTYTYDVSFVFVCNKLLNMTYSYLDRIGRTTSITYTYGEHTPTLPTI